MSIDIDEDEPRQVFDDGQNLRFWPKGQTARRRLYRRTAEHDIMSKHGLDTDAMIDLTEETADATGSAPQWMVAELAGFARAARKDRAEILELLRQCLAEDHGDHRPTCSPAGECFHGRVRELIARIDGGGR